ncbi:alpha/beta hydrolase [Herbiconiux moechotypicola]|uniref:Alpha/beta hydrolase n=1 Tax=Herbiconiux moechotypicola TaxID=637393 RepID=A0ABN3DF45_9MICO|nr:alpha/beta hydrolase [Herbiconiux moechotypicola]MCS5729380.1 alpha/beta hydrolase [Herbiconiux moechotypicola]
MSRARRFGDSAAQPGARHREVAGAGSPTVVFEAGLGMSGVVWALVHPRVAEHTRAVVSDRRGIGRSADAVGPRTLDALAAELGTLLDELGGPFVLVGHSWGGPIARVAAAGRDDVRALVLVDPSDEHLDEYFTPATRRRMAIAGPVTRAAAALGLYRRASSMGDVLSPDARRRFRDENFGRRAARQLDAEVAHFLPGLAALRAHPPAVDAALTIVSGSGGAIEEAHARSVALAGGRLVVAEGAGHNVMLTDPDTVVDAVVAAVLAAPPAG